MIAHQRLIRERLATGDPVDASLAPGAAEVRPITYRDAKAIILKYEWLGTMPIVPLYHFGIFFDGVLGGAVVFAPEPAENLGVWDRYGYSGRIIMLARGACAHWTPTNTASRLIAAAVRQLPPRYSVITATVDALAGEIGVIYQACNFDYVGNMSGERISRPRRPSAKPTPRKRRYFLFRGPDRRRLRAAIAHMVKPYPKRGDIAPAALRRRSPWHPTGKQKRKTIAKLLKVDPSRSNVEIARLAGATDKTVASERAKLESTSEIPRLSARIGADGRARPASRPGLLKSQDTPTAQI